MKRDEQFKHIAEALGIDLSASYSTQRAVVLELALENYFLRGQLEAIREYEGLHFAADEPIPYELTPKAEALVKVDDIPKMDPATARMASPELIPDSALVAAAAPVTEEEVGF